MSEWVWVVIALVVLALIAFFFEVDDPE